MAILLLSGCGAEGLEEVSDSMRLLNTYIESQNFDFDYIYFEGQEAGEVVGCLFNARVLSDNQRYVFGCELISTPWAADEKFDYIRTFQFMIEDFGSGIHYRKITTAIFSISKETGEVAPYDWLGLDD